MTATTLKRGRGRVRSHVPGIRALDRGLCVLEVLSCGNGASLSDVARASRLTCSTTFRILETLSQRGYAVQDSLTGLYRLGPSALKVGGAYSATSSLLDIADATMQRLVDVTNETVNLAVRDGIQVVYVHQVESKQSVRMFTQLGAKAPVYCTGVGKVLLAWRSPEEVASLMPSIEFERLTPNTIRTKKALSAELPEVRDMGYAIDDEERELGVRCISAPIWDANNIVVAALSISAPASRFPKKLIPQRAKEVVAAANDISLRLGHFIATDSTIIPSAASITTR